MTGDIGGVGAGRLPRSRVGPGGDRQYRVRNRAASLRGSAAAVVIPAFNESATLRDVVTGVLRHVARVIVIDDGSVDDTACTIADLPVIVLRNARNMGKAASIVAGAREAVRRGATAVVTIDGDGQHDPADLPLLLDAYRAASDSIVIGARLHARDAIPTVRYLANRFANFWISWAAGYPIADTQSGYRVYPASLLAQPPAPHDPAASFVFESEILIAAARVGVNAVCVQVAVRYPDAARRSYFRPVVDIVRIALMVTGHLVSRGLYPAGLVRSLQRPKADDPATAAERRRLAGRYAGQ